MRKILGVMVFAGLPLGCLAQEDMHGCHAALQRADFSSAVRLGREAGSYEGLLCVGKAQLANGDSTGAATTFADLAKIADTPSRQLVAMVFRARAAKASGGVQQALDFYEHALMLARSLGQRQSILVTLNESGKILQANGNPQGALDRFREAYGYAANDNERAECNHLMAEAYSALGNHDKAIEHQLKSVMLEERSGDLDHYLAARMALAAISLQARDFNRAQREIEESLPVAQVNASPYWEARILLQSARLEQARGSMERSKNQIDRARAIAQQLGDVTLLRELADLESGRGASSR